MALLIINNLSKQLFICLILLSTLFVENNFAQDSTRSEAFRENFSRRQPLIKAKYPSYSLIAGYLLVSEANRNDPFAQHELGIRYLLGNGFSADTVKAIYWIRKAVDQNLPAARFNYGIMLYNGIGVPWNPFEAFQNFKAAAVSGLAEAQLALGLIYTDNLTVSRNLNESYRYLKLATQANNKDAKLALDQLLKSGFIPSLQADSIDIQVNKTADESSNLMNTNWELDYFDFESGDKSNELNNEEFIKNLIEKDKAELKKYLGINEVGDSLHIKDTTSVGLINYAAEIGSPEALLIIGRCYELGYLFEKDLVRSSISYLRSYRLGSFKAGESLFKMSQNPLFISILQKGVKDNFSEAKFIYSALAALGFNNQITSEQALALLQSAAKANHIPSLIEMGLLHSLGTIVPKDKNKAIEYWTIAKDLGSREANIRMALLSLTDSSVQKSENEINTLIQLANEGAVLAQTALGYCFENGIGVNENKAQAVKYYRNAAQRGNQTAFYSLKKIYDDIRPDNELFRIYE
ncbi:MAG: sel1 repeat family protein [Melioribacteraceae bacterium]|nr:sel1 repeat family protein [Melioribacteraceae bacterium]